MAHRICNFCGELPCPAPKGSKSGHHLQDACVGKGGSNPYVICILLILAIDILRAFSWAQPCPAATMGSKAKFHSRQSASIYLFYTVSNCSETPKTICTYFGWQGMCRFFTSFHLDLSVTSSVFVTQFGSNQEIWKPEANVVGYLQEDYSANHIAHFPGNSDLKKIKHPHPQQSQACTSMA